jgi:hypothetical protein
MEMERSMNQCRKPGAGLWIAVWAMVLVMALAYPLSLGPVTRLVNEDWCPEWIGYFYVPLVLIIETSPEPLQHAFQNYIDFWLPTP